LSYNMFLYFFWFETFAEIFSIETPEKNKRRRQT